MKNRLLSVLSYLFVFLLIAFHHSLVAAGNFSVFENQNITSEKVTDRLVKTEINESNTSLYLSMSTVEVFDTHFAPGCAHTYRVVVMNIGDTVKNNLLIVSEIPSEIEVIGFHFSSDIFDVEQVHTDYYLTLKEGQQFAPDQYVEIFIDFKINSEVLPGTEVFTNVNLPDYGRGVSHRLTVVEPIGEVVLFYMCKEGQGFVDFGDTVSFRIIIANIGSKGFTGMVFDDLRGNNLEFVSYELEYGNFDFYDHSYTCGSNLPLTDNALSGFAVEFDSLNHLWHISIPPDCDFLRGTFLSIIVHARQLPTVVSKNDAYLYTENDTLSTTARYSLRLRGGVSLSTSGRVHNSQDWENELYANTGDTIHLLTEVTNTGKNLNLDSGLTITDVLPDCLDFVSIESVKISGEDIVNYTANYPNLILNRELLPDEKLQVEIKSILKPTSNECVYKVCVEAYTRLSSNPMTVCREVFIIDLLSNVSLDEHYPDLIIYPNPTKDLIMVDFKTNVFTDEISIFNSLGQLIEVDSRTINDQVREFDLSSQADGLYFLRVNTADGQVVTKPFIIQR